MQHFFFIHLSVEGRFGCFHSLLSVNKAPMIQAEQVSVEWDMKSFGHMPRSGHMVDLGGFCFCFLFCSLPSVAGPFCILLAINEVPFCPILSSFVAGCFVDLCHSDLGKGEISKLFDSHFSNC